ncbi:hypothetical protein QQF64_005887 [Cirrhinus molitorella]|uniref:MHC class I antigen n=1 Tax=Cirrhinus molitorella TaxID=172907 RepID=A0ABR3MHG7_9TELE
MGALGPAGCRVPAHVGHSKRHQLAWARAPTAATAQPGHRHVVRDVGSIRWCATDGECAGGRAGRLRRLLCFVHHVPQQLAEGERLESLCQFGRDGRSMDTLTL